MKSFFDQSLSRSDISPGVMFTTCMGIVFTVLSQIQPALQLAYGLIWISLVIYCAVSKLSTIKFVGVFSRTIGLFIFFTIFCLLSFLFTGSFGYVSGYLTLISKAMLMYIVGNFLYYLNTDTRIWNLIAMTYVVSAGIYGLWAITTYVPSLNSWLNSQIYLFSSKNSYGQIAGVASLILAAVAIREERPRRYLSFIASLAFIISLILAQCRTSLIALTLALLVLLIYLRQKKLLIIAVLLAVILFCFSPVVQSFISHALFLDKYQGADLDTFSSGRLGHWAHALLIASKNPFFGVGGYYVDCFYINTYVNVGLCGFLIVISLWGLRVTYNVIHAWEKSPKAASWNFLCVIALVLTIFYLIESMLEGFPPFGPGASSFFFWMLSGYIDAAYAEPANMNNETNIAYALSKTPRTKV